MVGPRDCPFEVFDDPPQPEPARSERNMSVTPGNPNNAPAVPDVLTEALELGPDTLVFTLCQVPVCYELSDHASVTVEKHGGDSEEFHRSFLAADLSSSLFRREELICRLRVKIPRDSLFP
jgi:hypothetical protein